MSDDAVCCICKSNGLISEDSQQRGYCSDCRDAFGLWQRAVPTRRPPSGCARCGHNVLVRCQVRERGASAGEAARRYLAPLAVTFHRLMKLRLFSNIPRPHPEPDFDRPAGVLEAHVCRACGFVDWYALDPQEIPIGPEYGTELVGTAPQAPCTGEDTPA